jgi:uncharacterized membrane protein YccC
MTRELGRTFDSIESAHDFVSLLSEAVTDARRDIDNDVQRESNGKSSRRLEALRLASYSLEKLEAHMTKSRRILNDLRSLRRLLFQERAAQAASVKTSTAAPARRKPEAGSKPLKPNAAMVADPQAAIPGRPVAV